MRSQRNHQQLRDIRFTQHFTKHAEGSVLVEYGDTKVICTASVTEGVPRFLKDKKQGWITAEYGMLPRSTHERMMREASSGKQGGRTLEIQRLIGRALRAAVDVKKFTDYTIYIDCDVLQADGGTRTASISGACVALADAFNSMLTKKLITQNPLTTLVASVSVGICDGIPLLDLDYSEDSHAQTDMNIVMNEALEFIEIQGTAEQHCFSEEQLLAMLNLAKKGISEIIAAQRTILKR